MRGKYIKIYKGALEKQGLSEVTYFIKKAEQNMAYAREALDGTPFTDASMKSSNIKMKLMSMRRLNDEIVDEIDRMNLSMYNQIQDIEEKEEDKQKKEDGKK